MRMASIAKNVVNINISMYNFKSSGNRHSLLIKPSNNVSKVRIVATVETRQSNNMYLYTFLLQCK